MVATGIVAGAHQILSNMILLILSGAPTLYEQLPALNVFAKRSHNQSHIITTIKFQECRIQNNPNLVQRSPSVGYFLV
ncbi:hypothetical protein Patl1_10060 [Pistacia atlantica]|uniref:Uncharacterized protein n=1 Tax=Pistacia atlantica TaxID=434234 RepID=A0ACC1A0D0_9ROSI|nr:hypothetical protein Patl1_10060 [Pistacia atlantica]